MPLKRCTLDGSPGWKYGDSGRCYTYSAGDVAGEERARSRALRQAAAMHAHGYTGKARADDEELALRVRALALRAGVLKFNTNRWPAGSNRGGQFAPKGAGAAMGADKSWAGPDGKPLPEGDQARLKALRVPPAWKDVRLNADPTAALQVKGVDAKGRTQFIYSAEHAERAAAEKFARLKDFHEKLPGIREGISQALAGGDDAALVLHLIERTGLRIGSGAETQAAVKAYGASTLLTDHVSVKGDEVAFDFTGKKGVRIQKTVKDATLARALEPRLGTPGQRLFKTNAESVRGLLKSLAGDEFKVKDFRTWHGTAKALEAIRSMPVPKSPTARKKAVAAVCKTVAAHLGNTPAVAKSAYIDPGVWSGWEAI